MYVRVIILEDWCNVVSLHLYIYIPNVASLDDTIIPILLPSPQSNDP